MNPFTNFLKEEREKRSYFCHSTLCCIKKNFQYFRKAFFFPSFCAEMYVPSAVAGATRGVLREARGTQGPSHSVEGIGFSLSSSARYVLASTRASSPSNASFGRDAAAPKFLPPFEAKGKQDFSWDLVTAVDTTTMGASGMYPFMYYYLVSEVVINILYRRCIGYNWDVFSFCVKFRQNKIAVVFRYLHLYLDTFFGKECVPI